MATPIKQIKTNDDVTHDIQSIEYIVGTQASATNMWAGNSSSDELYAGKVISYRLPVAGSTNSNTHTGLTTNTTLELTLASGVTVVHPVFRNASTAITTQYPKDSVMRLVFDPTTVTLNGHTFEGSWKTADYDSDVNDGRITSDYYYRPYAGQTIYRYKLVALGEDNRVYPIVTTNQTSTTQVAKVPTTTPLRPGRIWYYNPTTTVNAGSAVGAQSLRSSMNMTTDVYTFNASTGTHRDIYLRGTYDKDKDLFTLYNDGSSPCTSYYVFVPNNTANLNLASYLVSGYYYWQVGGGYSTTNYTQLWYDNPLYYFDGTNLIPVATKIAKDIASSAASSISWGSITNPPASYTPTSHSHGWSEITGAPAAYTPTSHTHDYSKVTFTQTNTSGDEIGKITIDGVTTTLYADADTDTKVSQVLTSTNSNYPIIFAYDTSTTTTETRTNTVRRDNDFYYNPSTNKVTVPNISATAATFTTINGVTVGSSPKFTDTTYTAASFTSTYDSRYAASSHTHSASDITGIPAVSATSNYIDGITIGAVTVGSTTTTLYEPRKTYDLGSITDTVPYTFNQIPSNKLSDATRAQILQEVANGYDVSINCNIPVTGGYTIQVSAKYQRNDTTAIEPDTAVFYCFAAAEVRKLYLVGILLSENAQLLYYQQVINDTDIPTANSTPVVSSVTYTSTATALTGVTASSTATVLTGVKASSTASVLTGVKASSTATVLTGVKASSTATVSTGPSITATTTVVTSITETSTGITVVNGVLEIPASVLTAISAVTSTAATAVGNAGTTTAVTGVGSDGTTTAVTGVAANGTTTAVTGVAANGTTSAVTGVAANGTTTVINGISYDTEYVVWSLV